METYLPALVVFLLVMAGMAVGVIVSNRHIKGSCGGLGAMRDDLGQPICECGANPGEICDTDNGLQFAPEAASAPVEVPVSAGADTSAKQAGIHA